MTNTKEAAGNGCTCGGCRTVPRKAFVTSVQKLIDRIDAKIVEEYGSLEKFEELATAAEAARTFG